MNDLFGVEFFSEKQVRAVVKVKDITIINDDGNQETIKVHGQFSFDGYLELTTDLKTNLGLDNKWIGVAFEFMGTYWHNLPAKMESDRKKRLICKDKNIILIEIWENIEKDDWLSEIIKQIEEKTGTKVSETKFSDLRRYLGNLKKT